MSTVFRVFIGIGLFTVGFQLGRAVGRIEPVANEFKKMKRRQGIVIDGEVEEKQEAQAEK